jgi:hypothetical protein
VGSTIQVVERDRGVARVILPETTGWMRVVGDASFVVLDASLSEPGCRVRHVRPE